MNGIRGLGTLAPGLSVRRNANALTLAVGQRIVLRHSLPDPDSAEAWADLTVRAWTAGRNTAKGLAAADAEQVYEAVFDASLAPLDPFSKYASASEARTNRERRYGQGNVGLGLELRDGGARITKVRDGGPAAKAGLGSGDWLTHIDDTAVSGLSLEEISERLRGPAGSWATLTVKRSLMAAPRFVSLQREHMVEETVATALGNGILYLGIKGFNRATPGRIWSLIDEATHDPGGRLTHAPGGRLKGVILDLRGNPGGLLHESIKVADLFLDAGPVIATRGRHPDSIQSYEARGRDVLAALPMVVLIDGGSASAAEIVAAALRDRGRALVIGTDSYGKGSVQSVVALPNKGELIVTWSRFVSPSGRVLEGRGISPTICTSGMNGGRAAPHMASLLSEHLEPPRPRTQVSNRSWCPPQSRGTALEIEIAHRVLSDWPTYSALIDPGTETSQAMSTGAMSAQPQSDKAVSTPSIN